MSPKFSNWILTFPLIAISKSDPITLSFPKSDLEDKVIETDPSFNVGQLRKKAAEFLHKDFPSFIKLTHSTQEDQLFNDFDPIASLFTEEPVKAVVVKDFWETAPTVTVTVWNPVAQRLDERGEFEMSYWSTPDSKIIWWREQRPGAKEGTFDVVVTKRDVVGNPRGLNLPTCGRYEVTEPENPASTVKGCYIEVKGPEEYTDSHPATVGIDGWRTVKDQKSASPFGLI